MRINWCVISFKFNFLGEATFKTLPRNSHGDIFLIHAGKPEGLSTGFNHYAKADKVFEIEEPLRYGQNLDRILIEQRFPEILDCDWLVMFDHDLYINDQDQVLRMLTENCSAANLVEFLIIGCENYWEVSETNYVRYFLTTPLMIINMHHTREESTSWDAVLKEAGGESSMLTEHYYDTGQLLAEELGPERIKCYPRFPEHAIHHFSSEWQWMSDPHYKKYEPERFAWWVSRARLLVREGFFVPSAREIPVMRQYLFFREMLDQSGN